MLSQKAQMILYAQIIYKEKRHLHKEYASLCATDINLTVNISLLILLQ